MSSEIRKLSRQLYPKGRAFKMPFNGLFDRLHKALAISEAAAYADGLATLNAVLPDNDNFTAADATDWERRLGIYSSSAVSLADRKLAIKRKMAHPGNIKARQSHLYLQGQLQAAGFDVYVYENRFAGSTKTISEVLAPFALVGQMGDVQLADVQMGDVMSYFPQHFDSVQMGEVQMGEVQMNQTTYNKKIANFVEEQKDKFFSEGSNLRSTFFIGGDPIGTFADVPAVRKSEFRQLILRIKPAQTMAYLLINYT